MASWQMECCGASFREGAKVSWRLRHPNSAELAWLDTVLHDGGAATVDAIQRIIETFSSRLKWVLGVVQNERRRPDEGSPLSVGAIQYPLLAPPQAARIVSQAAACS